MTIPTIIANYKEKKLITLNKQAFSLVTQALNKIKADSNGFILTDVINPDGDINEVAANLAEYFKTSEINHTRYYIKYMTAIENSEGKNSTSYMYSPNLRLTNGMIIGINLTPGCYTEYTCNKFNNDGSVQEDNDGNPINNICKEFKCATLFVDVNGEKKPNQLGKDAFIITITKNEYSPACSIFGGCIEDIIKYNKLPDNVNDYEIGGDFIKNN